MAEEETKIEETPPLEEEPPKETEKPAAEVEELLAELEKVGITDATKLQGTIRASREAGNLANLVGELRAEIGEMKKAKERVPAQEQDVEPAGQDLEQLMNTILDKRDTKKAQDQYNYNRMVLQQHQEIKDDKFYPQVKEIWDEKLKDANFAFEIQNGIVNPVKEYDKLVREYLVGMAQRSAETIKTMQGGKPLAPHVESGAARVSVTSGSTDEDKMPKTKELREKTLKGHVPTEEEQLEAIGEMLK